MLLNGGPWPRFTFFRLLGSHVLLASLVAGLVVLHPASAAQVAYKAHQLLQETWMCPIKNSIVTRTHMSWGVAVDHTITHADDVVEFVEQKEEIYHNFETNDLTTVKLRTSIQVPFSQIAFQSVSDSFLTLTCDAASKCIGERTSTALS